MSVDPKPRRTTRKAAALDQRVWIKAIRVAVHFDISESAVLRGDCGMDRIRWAYVPGTEGRKRPSRRFLWDDVIKLDKQMRDESAPQPDTIPDTILRLMGRGQRQRRLGRGNLDSSRSSYAATFA